METARERARPVEAGEARYLIHGVGVAVRCDHAEAGERIDRYLEPYRLAAGEREMALAIRVEIAFGDIYYPVPLRSQRVLRYGRLRTYYLEGATWFTDYFSTLSIDPAGATIAGNLSPETIKDSGASFFVDLLFNLALFEALRFHGLYYLHAAAVQGPDGVGYLISGNAGSGKTSLTLSLIHAGFKFLSDDTVFLRLAGEADVEVLGFARDFHVPADLVAGHESLSYLAGLADYKPYLSKKRLRPDEWFADKRIGSIKNPRVILFSQLWEDGVPLLRVPAAEALTELLPQSLSVIFHPRLAPLHLEALRRVLKHSRAFRLAARALKKGDPLAARQLLEQARDQALSRE